MRQNIFRKYIITTCAIVLFFFTVISVLLTVYYNNFLANEKYKSLDSACAGIAEYIDQAENDERINSPDRGLYYIMGNINNLSEIDVFLTDNNGVIRTCVCSLAKETGRCNHIGKTVNAKYLKSNRTKNNSLDTMGIYDSPRYISVREIKTDSKQVGYVFATASAMAIKVLIKKVAKLYIFCAVLPVVLLFAVLYYLTYHFTKPIKLMSEATRSMAKGDFSKRIPVRSDDEIGKLAASFNQMTDSLARLEKTRKDFVANVSHELRTPMTTIGGFIDGILDGTIERDKQDHYLSLASDEIKRLSRMIESMLNISRLESNEFALKYEQFDLKDMIINIVISQEQRIDEMGYLIEGLDEIPSVTVNADKDLIYRAIYNLVDNAVKFTDKNGRIIFKVKSQPKKVVFSISNTGNGIQKSDLPYVFERFYKGDKSRSAVKTSTGLGLYLVKTIIKNHGGNITVSSAENKLTTFEFSLPTGG